MDELVAKSDRVLVTITKFGEGKVSTGIHEPGGDIMAAKGDVLEVTPDVAASLEAKGYAEAADGSCCI